MTMLLTVKDSNLTGLCSEEHTGDKCCCVCVWWYDVQEMDIPSSFLSAVPPNSNDKRRGGLVGGYLLYNNIINVSNNTLSSQWNCFLSLFPFLSLPSSKSHMLSPFISLSLPPSYQGRWDNQSLKIASLDDQLADHLGCDGPNINNRLSCTQSTILIVVWK